MPNQSGKVVLVLILLLLLLGTLYYFLSPSFKKKEYTNETIIYSPITTMGDKEASKSSAEMKDYHSEALKVVFEIPKNAQIEEKLTITTIKLPQGEISVMRVGTNYPNAKDYYSDLKQKNNLFPLSYNEGKTNKYEYVTTTNEFSRKKSEIEKTYFVYADNRIFSFSTSDETLYSVLDQIVQSFEYKP